MRGTLPDTDQPRIPHDQVTILLISNSYTSKKSILLEYWWYTNTTNYYYWYGQRGAPCSCLQRVWLLEGAVSMPHPITDLEWTQSAARWTDPLSRYNSIYEVYYPSSYPCRSSNSSPPSAPPPFLFPAQFVQTPHLQSKSARVIDTSKQLISRHYFSSHPWRSFCSFIPPPPLQRPLLPHTPHDHLDPAPRM